MKPRKTIISRGQNTRTNKRLFALLGLILCGVLPNHLLALGLGEISSVSKLGEPLNASIILHNAGNLSNEELIIKLGDTSQYAQLGLDRPYYHQELRFNLTRNEKAQLQIEVSTKNPLNEPYLNFILQIRWPDGVLVKEFKVLLDPPQMD